MRALPDGIRVDDTRYDTVRYADAWPDSYRATGQVGPVGALTVDGGWNDPAGRRGTPPDPAIAAGEDVHRWLSYTLLVLIVVHIVAALRHHYVKKNDILRRML